jgi:hypothetical protein
MIVVVVCRQVECPILLIRPSTDGTTAQARTDQTMRARTRGEIYQLYCTFGEKKHCGEDFLSKIMNILRDSIEGLLSHAEVNRSSLFLVDGLIMHVHVRYRLSLALLQRKRLSTRDTTTSITREIRWLR